MGEKKKGAVRDEGRGICEFCGDPIREGEMRQWVLGSKPERFKHFGCGAKPGSAEANAAAYLVSLRPSTRQAKSRPTSRKGHR